MGRYILKSNKLVFDKEAKPFEYGDTAAYYVDEFGHASICIYEDEDEDKDGNTIQQLRLSDLHDCVNTTVINDDLWKNEEFQRTLDDAWETVDRCYRSLLVK